MCQGQALEISLLWPAVHNTQAVGARLALHTRMGVIYRDVRVSCGYLSGSPARVHFGFPEGTTLERLEIQWTDGAVTIARDLAADTWVTVTRQEP